MMATPQKRVIVNDKSGRSHYVRAGEIDRDTHGRINTFRGLKLTTAKRWAARFSIDESYDVASAINQTAEMGFYSQYSIEFAHVGASV
jgi:hypothetical protein